MTQLDRRRLMAAVTAAMLAQAGAVGDDVADRPRPLLVPPHSLEPPLNGPAPVSVHDDGDVAGDLLVGNVLEEVGGGV